MVAPLGAEDWSGHDWKTWQWKPWDDGHDKVGALETRLEALETRFCDICTFYKGQFEKQECARQDAMAMSDDRFKWLEKQDRDREESMALLERDHAELQQKFEDVHKAHNEMWERFLMLEGKLSDVFFHGKFIFKASHKQPLHQPQSPRR